MYLSVHGTKMSTLKRRFRRFLAALLRDIKGTVTLMDTLKG